MVVRVLLPVESVLPTLPFRVLLYPCQQGIGTRTFSSLLRFFLPSSFPVWKSGFSRVFSLSPSFPFCPTSNSGTGGGKDRTDRTN